MTRKQDKMMKKKLFNIFFIEENGYLPFRGLHGIGSVANVHHCPVFGEKRVAYIVAPESAGTLLPSGRSFPSFPLCG